MMQRSVHGRSADGKARSTPGSRQPHPLSKPRRVRQRARQGMVLVVVVVIVMTVSLAAYHFTLSMESEHLAAANTGQLIVDRQNALSGVELVAAWLEQPRQDRPPDESLESRPIPLWPAESGAAEAIQITIDDEAAKLSLQRLLQWESEAPGTAQQALLEIPGMDSGTADRLLDWIDADSDPRPQGDETQARNALPLTIEELAFLHAEVPVPAAGADAASETPGEPPWLRYLTIHSAERNRSFDGQPRIFVNADNLADLHASLRDRVPQALANYIVWYRQYGPSRRSASNPQQGIAAETPVDLARPARFQIENLAVLLDSAVEVPVGEATGGDSRQVISSPFGMLGGSGGEIPIDEVFDRLTASPLDRLEGRINVMSAPAAVLAAIPGLDRSLAERLVASRMTPDQGFRHPVGLLSSLAIDLTMVKRVLPHLTIGSDVARVIVADAVADAPAAVPSPAATRNSETESAATPPGHSFEAILDASSGPARLVGFRKLPHPLVTATTELSDLPAPAPAPAPAPSPSPAISSPLAS